MLADAKIILWPTHAFSVEQIKNNVHESRLNDAVLTEDGTVMLEPDRKSHPGFVDFEKAKARYQSGTRLTPKRQPPKLSS